MPSAVVKSQTPADSKDTWRTPPDLFRAASYRYGPFDLDAAADHDNHLCDLWLGPGSQIGEDALAVEWGSRIVDKVRRVWLNPPYSMNKQFVAKAAEEAREGRAQTTLLLPATTDVRWWHEFVEAKPNVLVELLSPRVRFLRPDGSLAGSPNFGSALVTFLLPSVSEMLAMWKPRRGEKTVEFKIKNNPLVKEMTRLAELKASAFRVEPEVVHG